MWSTLHFGKHKGASLPQVLLTDPDWFWWALEGDVFRPGTKLAAEAEDLAAKARHVRIPKLDPENWRVQYFFGRDGKFHRFEIVAASLPPFPGIVSGHLDLSIVRKHARYDKLGNHLLLKGFKAYYFGSPNARLTRERCEAFFDEPTNFELPTLVQKTSKGPREAATLAGFFGD
jgi:hypothetical protein